MTGASMFWLDALYDLDLNLSLQLPFDRYCLGNEHRTGRGISTGWAISNVTKYCFENFPAKICLIILILFLKDVPRKALHNLYEQILLTYSNGVYWSQNE